MNTILDFLRGLFGRGGGGIDTNVDPPPVDPNDPCQAPACVNAKAALDSARAKFTSTCNSLRSVHSVNQALVRAIVVPVWTLIVLVVVAVVLWFLGLGFLAVLIWALVLVYVVLWIVVLVTVRIEGSLAQSLAEAGQAVAAAIQDVIKNCPETCRGDLSVPTCPLP